MTNRLLITLALVAAIATPAAAQTSRVVALAQIRAEFVAGDTNHDGVLTRAEVAARISRMRTGGGARAMSPAQTKRLTDLWFARTDRNHDGKVTLAEAQGEMAAMFDRYDANRDGTISPDEMRAARAAAWR